MKTKMTWHLVAAPLVVLGLAYPMVGCEELAEAQAGLCCSEFNVGADLSGVDFEAGVEFNAVLQASADFAATATGMATDVAGACQAMATDLGADENAVKSMIRQRAPRSGATSRSLGSRPRSRGKERSS